LINSDDFKMLPDKLTTAAKENVDVLAATIFQAFGRSKITKWLAEYTALRAPKQHMGLCRSDPSDGKVTSHPWLWTTLFTAVVESMNSIDARNRFARLSLFDSVQDPPKVPRDPHSYLDVNYLSTYTGFWEFQHLRAGIYRELAIKAKKAFFAELDDFYSKEVTAGSNPKLWDEFNRQQKGKTSKMAREVPAAAPAPSRLPESIRPLAELFAGSPSLQPIIKPAYDKKPYEKKPQPASRASSVDSTRSTAPTPQKKVGDKRPRADTPNKVRFTLCAIHGCGAPPPAGKKWCDRHHTSDSRIGKPLVK
jgi:hypothetical protein